MPHARGRGPKAERRIAEGAVAEAERSFLGGQNERRHRRKRLFPSPDTEKPPELGAFLQACQLREAASLECKREEVSSLRRSFPFLLRDRLGFDESYTKLTFL